MFAAESSRPPLPPFGESGARAKVQAAEEAWNSRDPERVAAAYTVDSVRRNRDGFVIGRAAIVARPTRKWERGYRRSREASINDVPIAAEERRIFGPRPAGDLTDLPLRRDYAS